MLAVVLCTVAAEVVSGQGTRKECSHLSVRRGCVRVQLMRASSSSSTDRQQKCFVRREMVALPVCGRVVYMLCATTVALGRAMVVGGVRPHAGRSEDEDFASDGQLV